MRVPWWLNPWGEAKAARRLNDMQAETIRELVFERDYLDDEVRGLRHKAAQVNQDKWRQARELNRKLREIIAQRDTSIDRAHKLVAQKNAEIAQLKRGRARVTWPAEEEVVFGTAEEIERAIKAGGGGPIVMLPTKETKR